MLFAALHTSHAALQRFEVLKGTQSPSGRYAIAWGVRGRKRIDFKRVHDHDYPYIDKLTFDKKHPVEDYLIDARSGKVLAVLDGLHYSTADNWGSVEASWDRRERCAVIVWHGKWGDHGASFVDLALESSPTQAELFARVKRDLFPKVARAVTRHFGRRRSAVRKDLENTWLSLDVSTFGPSRVRLSPEAFHLWEWTLHAEMVYTIGRHGETPRLHLQLCHMGRVEKMR